MADHAFRTVWIVLLLLTCASYTLQNTRQKRQISPQQPKIITTDGHLVFQTGINHNITFKSTAGGYVNVNGENLVSLAQTVKSNKQAIDELKAFPTEIPSNIEGRLTSVEERLNNLQPTGGVQTQLISLANRLNMLETANLVTRLATIEQQMTGLQNIPSSLTTLTTRVSALERSVRTSRNDRTRWRINRRVRTLQTQVTNLRSLLTQNECSSNPCRNGGTCIDRYNAYSCRCLPAWKGENCDEDVNECSEYAGTDRGCQNGATCVNNRGGFSCQCTSNYHGIRCTETHADCTGASTQELCGHGTCINTVRVVPGQPKYHCVCEDGWTTSGSDPACNTDVDECDSDRPAVCSADPPVPCVNVPGTFYCGQCPTGYSGNGFNCADINECATNNGGCSLSPRVDCVNTRGSRTCGPCPTGYVGDGQTCNWVGVCSTNNGGCHPQASCQESPGVLTCTCPPGYVGNGIGSSGCVSQGPVTGPCSSNPCRNGAACQTNGNSFLCVCIPGYQGQQCETNINECASSPCQNGGTCTDQVNGYTCQCNTAYSGINCQEEQQTCGGHRSGETGTITFPTTPGTTYPHGLSCAYRITTTPGMIVMMTFTSFSVEAHATCGYDFLQINDGPTAASYTLGRYCGSTLPNNGQPINSTQHQMYFWFFTDVSVSDTGFSATWTSAPPVCGGRLANQLHGSINSPGYPGNYPHDRTCSWEISVPPGNNIMFTFATLALESHPNCSYDYLEIRDGPLPSSQILQRYCNTSQPPPLSTTGPSAFVKFHSDATLSDHGFHITYVTVSAGDQCGGVLTSETGVLTSPNYPGYYDHNGYCAWSIYATPGDSISLTFTDMDLENGGCSYDYVEVRDGDNEDAPLFGRYCGSSIPSTLVTSGNHMFIEFRTDGSVRDNGFRAQWTSVCGGLYTSLLGTFSSPNFPNPYPHNKECIYTINQQNGFGVTLTFTSFDVEGTSGSSCPFDYVEVRDGSTETAPLLGHFCGSEIPDPVISSQSNMWVKFVTDHSVQNLGFSASYVGAPIPCGMVLTDTSGTIQSPGHPNIYPHGANCTWRITVDAGLVIRLTFATFTLEGSGSSCYFDYVDIYDNSSAVESSRLGRYCGQTIPPSMTSTDNVMTITFRSDSSVAHEGFTASYVTLNASTICGGTFTTSTGIITSPNFPDNYPHQRECVWTIIAPMNIQVLLNVTDFQLESHANCMFDFLEIRNGGFEDSPLVNKYCGNTIDTIIQSHSNRMWLKFQSDGSLSARGFRIMYEATATGCGADLNTPTGSFISPNYPNTYSHNAECFWTITVSRGSQIILNITDIDMEGSSSSTCYFDYILIRDGTSTGRQLGKFCGTTIPGAIQSSANLLWVKYKTDYSVAGRGFHISYRTVCNVRLTGFSGVIESPNFPQPYPHNRNCTWIIETSQGNTISAAFSHFDVETHHSCAWDYLQIRDGELTSSASLGRFCGTNLPAPVNSTSSKMLVHFMSDFSVASNGFRLEYVTNGCGGYLVNPTGNFTSPNYPSNYPHARVCEWQINLATGVRIELTLNDFDFEPHVNCGYDGLEIYGGMDSASPLLITLCHTQTQPQVFTSTGNQMLIRFRSDVSISGRGFHASYRSLPGGCGGNFSTPSGTLTSANYPNNYPHDTECVWLITVAPSRNILLTFNEFILEGSSSCYLDYVKVFDGPTMNNTLLMTHCGSSLPSPPSYRSSANQMLVRMRTDSSVSRKGFNATYVTGCGGTLTAEQDGEIMSPNYPGNYGPGSNCSWLILGDHAGRLETCFRDGGAADSPEIARYCGLTIPDPVLTTTNQLRVEFHTDFSATGQGFLFDWQATSEVPPTTQPPGVSTTPMPGCGGIFSPSQYQMMTINSPGYPDGYADHLDCVWQLIAQPGYVVWFNVTDINLESHQSCRYDRLSVYDGPVVNNNYGPRLGQFCGRVGNAQPIQSTVSQMTLRFTTDFSINRTGFSVNVQTVCGGILRMPSGVLSSPSYPNSYPNNINCTWYVIVAIGRTIQVEFNGGFNVVGSGEACGGDSVQLLGGPSTTSPPIGNSLTGQYCGNVIPTPMNTSSNYLTVTFVSDGSGTGTGFQMQFTEVSVTCGGTLYLTDGVTSGYFTSPNYPNVYPHNVDCTWVITAPSSHSLQLDFVDNFYIEDHNQCRFDYIEVRDGGTINSPVLSHLCGSTTPSTVRSTGNVMFVRFRTDASVARAGFRAMYKIAECGGRIYGTSRAIMSPNYPSNYPSNSHCVWDIEAPTGHYLTFTFVNIDLEYSYNCTGDNRDFLEIRDINSTGPVLMRSCGHYNGDPIDTSDSFALVTFNSNAERNQAGFSIAFQASVEVCGGDKTTPTGTFTSPNFPGQYAHSRVCTWLITVQPGRRVSLTFDTFNLETGSNCRFDYVAVYDGILADSPMKARLCGETIPVLQESSGNTMKVVFRTDGSISNGGFRASYTSNNELVCGGTLTSNPGTITSPGYDTGANYTNNQQCVWVIANRNVTDTSVALRFYSFQLESHGNCNFDFLEIREGNSATSPLIGKYCGKTQAPPPIYSPSPYLWVRFRTDLSIVDRGFSLNYGFTGEEGVEFTNFSLEQHPNCVFDYVELFNGPFVDSPSVGKFCGTTAPPTFTSQYSAIRLIFKADVSISSQGFRLTYSFQSGGCGGLYHTNDGQITSPNYPQSYPHRTECVWDINVAPGYHVALTFNPPFDLESHAACSWDYVEVSNGLWNGSLLPLGRWCSNLTPPQQNSTTNRLVVKFRSDINTNGNGFSANWTVGCGSEFTELTGRIFSPGYPQQYENGLLCNYTIKTDPQRFIVLNFIVFELEGGSRCQYDYLQAFTGNSSSGRRLGKFCGNTIPQAVSSLGTMFLQFRTDQSIVARGFILDYRTSECGGIYTGVYGYIQTPQQPSQYHHNANCTWLITVAPDRAIYFKFTAFDLEAHSSCRYDYVDLRDGGDLSSPLIGRYCGNVVPEMVRTTSNTLLVNFISDFSVAGTGFTAGYRTGFGVLQGCGGILNTTSGSFGSIDIDGSGRYENDQDCLWTIIVGDDQLVVLSIPTVDIESATACHFDSLKIYDGMGTTEPLIGTYCGTNAPGVIRSTSNFLTVRFSTDLSVTNAGFNATYTQTPSLCGGAVISSNVPQTITSPGASFFPPDEPIQCRWTVDAPNYNERVRFTMTTINLDSDSSCSNEYVEFRDSPLGYGGRSMHYCGSTPPNLFESVGQTAMINYKALRNGIGHGFSLTYQTATCNRTYSGYSGQIHSPGWPGNYPSNIYCEIVITGPPNTWLTLYFNAFSIESHRSCRFDYLQVRNGSAVTAPVAATLCGFAIPDPIFGTGNSLWLGFRTDGSLTHPGFDITYTASNSGMGCGGNITGINGSLTSPGYPGNYTERHSCRWLITVPGRRVVSATFTDLNLIGSPDCNRDSVAVYNGNSEQQPIFGQYCGNETPATLVASGNVMLVKFTTDGIGSAPGFRITFTS
ncbi:cubilin-like [Mizuhopecten yessoensis]|uniref:cubilin-like n=1 Tax=Mizuhopecten yessoensis TaxID=6573 RepID=UPI000B45F8AB|nr:cubilin-like [Mizuhopecten yessoensis]